MNYSIICSKLEQAQNLYTTDMKELRDASGAKKLGQYVLEDIKKDLTTHKIGVYPALMSDQNCRIRIFKKNSDAGKLIQAVINLGEKSDELIRKYVSDKRSDILNTIKELVNEQ